VDTTLVLVDAAAGDELIYASKHPDFLLGQAGPETCLSKSRAEDRPALSRQLSHVPEGHENSDFLRLTRWWILRNT
jgi:hypothetical protein